MGKNYVADLQKWVEQKKGLNGRSANSARVVFLAIRDDVKEAIDAGYSLVTIWEHLHHTGKVKTTYETFRRHVKRFITEPAQQKRKTAESVPAKAEELVPAKIKKTNEIAGDRESQKQVPQERKSQITAEKTTQTGLPSFKFEPNKRGK